MFDDLFCLLMQAAAAAKAAAPRSLNKTRMEEHTLKLAQKLAREASIEEDNSNEEARDGNPMPLKSMAAKLEEKVKGFR